MTVHVNNGEIKYNTNVTLEHKTSHKGHFFEIEMYTSSER